MFDRWKFFVDRRAWDGSSRLFIRVEQGMGAGKSMGFVAPLVVATFPAGTAADTPTLAESREETEDGLGDVTGFLQAALDAAWEQGIRPTAYADHTNELKAVRYHLEDMRLLARVRKDA